MDKKKKFNYVSELTQHAEMSYSYYFIFNELKKKHDSSKIRIQDRETWLQLKYTSETF